MTIVGVVSLALYRRYRPDTFADLVGQDHVTLPLQQALRNNRVNHAYLFSGPRGCGKTTSARILARALNCEAGPTPTPCGACASCRDLATGGPGSIDVIEIDAASHGGVDDARDLRERAFFAPAASRYKIYIIDEAHMVTSAGFNALLKVVEEPPEHLKFIFATTEPEKVIGTIRSRTHHYPFRLVPPGVLRDHLADVCAREGATVHESVLPLVVRAGAGSVRDSMSVLDQLLAGAGPEGVTYPMATALLGYTDGALIDDVVDAFAARDGAAVFAAVDRVIEAGHDPRRFVADLLERFRDLVILAAAPQAAGSGLIDAPEDQMARMRPQAQAMGLAQLSRAADLLNVGLTEMRGATAPRLQLELVCARVLLPGADDGDQGLRVRLEEVERRLAAGGAPNAGSVPAAASPPTPRPHGQAEAGSPPLDRSSAPPPQPAPRPPAPTRGQPPSDQGADAGARQPRPATPDPAPAQPPPAQPPPAPAGPPSAGGVDVATLRARWPQVLETIKSSRMIWLLLGQNAQPAGVDGDQVSVAFNNPGPRDSFHNRGGEEVLAAALAEVLGGAWRVDCVVDPSGGAAPRAAGQPTAAPRPPAQPRTPSAAQPSGRPPSSVVSSSPPSSASHPAPTATPAAPSAEQTQDVQSGAGQPVWPTARTPGGAAPSAEAEPGHAGPPAAASRRPEAPSSPPAAAAGPPKLRVVPPPATVAPEDDIPADDDPDLDGDGLTSHELLARELGATVIEEVERP